MRRAVVLLAVPVALAVLAAVLFSGFTPAAADDAVLGPDGYKGLLLGQAEADAVASGLLVGEQRGETCTRYSLAKSEGEQSNGVWIAHDLGVVVIGGTTLSHTPENVTIGTDLASVQAAYPDLALVPPHIRVYAAAVPENPDRTYRFAVNDADLVTEFALNGPDLGGCGAAPPPTGAD